MTLYGSLIFALWLILVAYWSLSTGAAMRRSGSRWIWWREITIRLGFFALVVFALGVGFASRTLPNPSLFNSNRMLGLVGSVCTLLGMGLAVAARVYLGRNWGAAGSNPGNVELVTTGPYALVRHPLYSGLLFAMLGSAIGQSLVWSLPLIVYGPLFVVGALREERLLIERFPDLYRAYMKRTKMLLPFIL